MATFEDYYEILQVSRSAESEVIDAAYKKLAQKYHPDVNRNADAAERMKKINAAYEVLGNHERRKDYDAEYPGARSSIYSSEGHHVYFTADLHFRHKNIMRYCHRDIFNRDIRVMNNGLIANWNKVVSNYDTVYHLGDFCSTDDSDLYAKYMHRVNGRVVFLRGNHDDGLQHADYFIYRKIGGMKIFMRHWPPWEHPQKRKLIHSFDIPLDVDLILCGHVHNKWKSREHYVGQRRIPVINVGTDLWGYKPISLNDIREEVEKLVSSKYRRA
jgi:calcineurin-like phosphoesterase family protein